MLPSVPTDAVVQTLVSQNGALLAVQARYAIPLGHQLYSQPCPLLQLQPREAKIDRRT